MKNLTFSKISLSIAALALLAVFSLAGCGGGGGSDSTPAVPFPNTTEAFEKSLNEANVIAQDAGSLIDASIEAADQNQSFIDPAVLAKDISQIDGVESAEPTPTGSAIIVKKTDGLFFNVLVADMTDERLFEEQSNSAMSTSLSQSSRAMSIVLQKKAMSKASPLGSRALILAPISSEGPGDNIATIEGILSSAGYEVTMFKDSAAGLAQFRGDYLQQFDVIYIETHGMADVETFGGVKTTVLMTGERYGNGIPLSDTYKNLSESQRNSLAGVYPTEKPLSYIFNPVYFAISVPWLAETGASNFRNGFLFTMSCESSKYDSGEKSLSAAFFNLGGGAHVGFDEKINFILGRRMAEKALTEMSNGADLVTASNRTREDTDIGLWYYVIRIKNAEKANPQLFDDSQRIEEQPYVIVDTIDNDTVPPSDPTNLIATPVSASQINLSWTASTDNVGVAGYKIYRDGTYSKSVNITSTSDTGLSPATQYCYTVSAYDAAGNVSSQSSSVCATTQATGSPPSTPTGFAATAGNGQVTISWNAVSDATSYNIYWSTTSGVSKTSYIGKISNISSPYTHTGRTNGTTYYYVVTAVNGYGESIESSPVSATPISNAPSTWTKTFGGALDDSGYSIQQTSDGGYIIAGLTYSSGAGGNDVYLLKLDASGNKVWEKTFGGSLDDWAASVRQASDGGYILVGGTKSFGAGGEDVYLVKTDANGNKVWDKTFGGINRDFGCEVKQTSDGGYIITGISGYSASDHDVYLIRTDANGNKLWDKIFGVSSDDGGFSVQQTTDGGFIIAGGRDATYTFYATNYFTIAGGDVYLIKTDSNGNKTWEKSFGSTGGDIGLSVQQVSDGGYIISGWEGASSSSYADVYLVKTDTNGNMVWQQTFGGTYHDYGDSVQQTSDGGYIISGMIGGSGTGGGDVYLIKTNSSGSKLWEKTFGGTLNERGRSVQQTSDGGYIVVGHTDSTGAGGRDVYVIKTDSSGIVQTPLQSPALSPAKSSIPATRQYMGLGMEPVPMSR